MITRQNLEHSTVTLRLLRCVRLSALLFSSPPFFVHSLVPQHNLPFLICFWNIPFLMVFLVSILSVWSGWTRAASVAKRNMQFSYLAVFISPLSWGFLFLLYFIRRRYPFFSGSSAFNLVCVVWFDVLTLELFLFFPQCFPFCPVSTTLHGLWCFFWPFFLHSPSARHFFRDIPGI